MTERIEIDRTIAAPAADIFAVLTDPQGHVAIDSSGMLQDAEGDPVKAVGDSFVVHMDREALNDFPQLGKYDVTVEISEFDQDRLIAWTILGQIRPQINHVYGYRLQPAPMTQPRPPWSPRSTTGRTSTRSGARRGFSRSSPKVRCGRRSAFSTAPCAAVIRGDNRASPRLAGPGCGVVSEAFGRVLRVTPTATLKSVNARLAEELAIAEAQVERYVSDPHQIVRSGQVVRVKVVDVDVERQRIALSLRLNDQPQRDKRPDREPPRERAGRAENMVSKRMCGVRRTRAAANPMRWATRWPRRCGMPASEAKRDLIAAGQQTGCDRVA